MWQPFPWRWGPGLEPWHLNELLEITEPSHPVTCEETSTWRTHQFTTSVQFSSVAQLCPTLCDPMNHSTPGLPVHHQLPEFTQTLSIESIMPSSHLILYRPLLLLPPIPPSIRVFSNKSTFCMRWPKYWSFSFSISPSNEHPGLISMYMLSNRHQGHFNYLT